VGEPVVISQSGDDNSLKMWIFDKEMGLKTAPWLLKQWSGHSDPPHLL